jgi:hypothetical protein
LSEGAMGDRFMACTWKLLDWDIVAATPLSGMVK